MYLNHFMQITLTIQLVFKILAKASYRTNLLLCWYPSLFSTILRRGRLKQHDPGSSQQTTHYSTQNDSPVPLFITNIVWVLKTHLRTSNSPITRSIKDIFDLKTKQNTDLGERTAQPDGDDHWPVTVTSKNVFPRCLVMGSCRNKVIHSRLRRTARRTTEREGGFKGRKGEGIACFLDPLKISPVFLPCSVRDITVSCSLLINSIDP